MQISADSMSAKHSASRSGKTVLLVAEVPFVRELLAAHLRAAGCFPMAVATAEEGRRLSAQVVPDLIVCDVDAQPCVGAGWAFEVARSSPGKVVHVAVLASDMERACGSDGSACGASLCVSKPIEPRELVHRLLRLLRQAGPNGPHSRAGAASKVPSIEINSKHATVRLLRPDGWHSLDLSRTEHRLLRFLLKNATRVHSREEIRDAVWSAAPVDLRTVDQYVRRLRRSLKAANAQDLVKTVTGFGYRIELSALGQGNTPEQQA